jgi:hypothetical protein
MFTITPMTDQTRKYKDIAHLPPIAYRAERIRRDAERARRKFGIKPSYLKIDNERLKERLAKAEEMLSDARIYVEHGAFMIEQDGIDAINEREWISAYDAHAKTGGGG